MPLTALLAAANSTSSVSVGLGGSAWLIALVAVGLVVAAILILWFLRKFIVNSILGLIALVVLNVLGFQIPINLVSIVVCGLLGLFGVGVLLLLSLFGIHV